MEGKLLIPKRSPINNHDINNNINNKRAADHLDIYYKYFVVGEKEKGGDIKWEENDNHHLNVILSDCDNVIIRDYWGAVCYFLSSILFILPFFIYYIFYSIFVFCKVKFD